MRRFLLLSLLLGSVGCHGLHERIHCGHGAGECTKKECAPPAKNVATPPPERITTQPRETVAAPTIAQEVLFVPVTSYVPYARQTPTGPLRMTMPGQPIVGAPPSDIRTPPPPADVRTPPPADVRTPPPCEDKVEFKKLLDLCQKQCDRIDHLEKCIKERQANPAPPVCPPLFRRPLFNRCEPLFPRCEPAIQHCEPLVPCDPVDKKSSAAPPPSPPEVQPAILTIR